MIYSDTSLLLSFFLNDSGAIQATEQLQTLEKSPDSICWSPWLELELVCGIERAVGDRQRSTTRSEAANIYQEIKRWRGPAGIFEAAQLDFGNTMRLATQLAHDHAEKLLNRSLDTIHVASALSLEIETFWSFDLRQRNLAQEYGLLLNPMLE